MKQYLVSYHFSMGNTAHGFGDLEIKATKVDLKKVNQIRETILSKVKGATNVVILNIMKLED